MSNKLNNNSVAGSDKNPSDFHACGDQLHQSESGVELKSLLKMIDNVIEMSPATDDEVVPTQEYLLPDIEKINPFGTPRRFASDRSSSKPTNLKFEGKHKEESGKIVVSEVLMVPVAKYPKYNFVGRILGPRGMTVKQLEKETGCKIFVRGRASSTTFNPHTKAARFPFNNKATLSTISEGSLTEEPLHVYIECVDFPMIAAKKLAHGVAVVTDLLSPPIDGKDELKRQQLVDISLINGTYRATTSSQDILRPLRRFGQTVDPTSNPADFEVQPLNFDHGINQFGADFGGVYGITQQRRIWQKPRGPDSSSLEFAKSVSSREFVTDIVNKTKKFPKNSSEDSLFSLPQSLVSETLKVAQNLLASHQHLTFGSKSVAPSTPTPTTPTENSNWSPSFNSPNKSMCGAGDGLMKTIWKKDSSPPPLMSSNLLPPLPPFPSDFYYPPSPFCDFPHNGLYFMLPPPPTSPFSVRRY